MANGRTRHTRVRVYETLRTAHLERARQLAPASILFRVRRYDFDSALARGLDLHRAGPVGTAAILARSRVDEIEVNEPLMISSLRRTMLAVATVRLAGALRRRRTAVVTYAIANDPPFRAPLRPGVRPRLRRAVERLLLRLVARSIDRIVFGTPASRDLYARVAPGLVRTARTALIPALPAPCGCADGARDADRVLFVGSFEARKGIEQLVDAWPSTVRARPAATLTLVGKGPLLSRVEDLAAAHPEVELLVDPPRDEIHRQLRRAAVVVLLSQRTPTWREQVGLPLVEGLAHGCTVLASTETGLAPWLAHHGHGVLEPTVGPEQLAESMVQLLDGRRTAASVTADLPAVDGRLAADVWLFDRSRPSVPSPG